MTPVVVLLTVVVGVLAVLVLGLLRSHAEILRAMHDAGISLDPERAHDHGQTNGPRHDHEIRTRPDVPEPAGVAGQRATDVVGRTVDDALRTVSVKGEHPTLLAFLTTGCTTCAEFWSAFAEGVSLPGGARLVIVTKGPDLESPADVAALAPPGVLTLQSSQAWDDYSIPVAPYFALVDGRNGVVVGEGAAASWASVRELLERALSDAGYEDGRITRRSLLAGRARAERVDDDLRRAGFVPGDPRLYHDTLPVEAPEQ